MRAVRKRKREQADQLEALKRDLNWTWEEIRALRAQRNEAESRTAAWTHYVRLLPIQSPVRSPQLVGIPVRVVPGA